MFKIKRLEIINILYIFIYSSLAIIIPLYLLQKNTSLSSIGFILSLGPLIFLFTRVVLAAISDSIGTYSIDIFYSIVNIISVIIYYFASTPIMFGLGNVGEGLRNAGFWAVVRTEAMEEEKNNQSLASVFVHYSNLRQVGEGVGKILAAVILALVGFVHSFEIILTSSVALLLINLNIAQKINTPKSGNQKILDRILSPRSSTFWFSSLLQMFVWLPYNATSYFILPLYLHSYLGFSYEQTGLYLAAYILGVGIVASALRYLKFDMKKLYFLTSLIFVGFVAMPFFGSMVFIPIILISIGNGCSNIIAEYILSDQILRSRDVSTDIGLVYVPLKIFEFLFYLLGGLMISYLGYWFLFALCALSIALFMAFSRKVVLQSKVNL